MNREYPDRPFVGVGGVIFAGDAVLLARRLNEPSKGQWSLPGGVVELGETLLDAIRRELLEEASVEVEVGGIIDAFDRIVRSSEDRILYHYVIVDYWGRLLSGSPSAGSDASEVMLVPVKDIGKLEISRQVKCTIMRGLEMQKSSLSMD